MENEYQQAAAIMSLDIDVIAQIAQSHKNDTEMLYQQIMLLKERKDKVINDPELREMRYGAACAVFSVAVNRE